MKRGLGKGALGVALQLLEGRVPDEGFDFEHHLPIEFEPRLVDHDLRAAFELSSMLISFTIRLALLTVNPDLRAYFLAS